MGRTKVDVALCVLELNGRRKFLSVSGSPHEPKSFSLSQFWEWTGLSVLDKICMNLYEFRPSHAFASGQQISPATSIQTKNTVCLSHPLTVHMLEIDPSCFSAADRLNQLNAKSGWSTMECPYTISTGTTASS